MGTSNVLRRILTSWEFFPFFLRKRYECFQDDYSRWNDQNIAWRLSPGFFVPISNFRFGIAIRVTDTTHKS